MRKFALAYLSVFIIAPIYCEENLSIEGVWLTERPTVTWGQFKLKLEEGKFTYWYWSDNVRVKSEYPVTGTYSQHKGILFLNPESNSARLWSNTWVPYSIIGRDCMISTESYYLVDTGTEKIEDQHYICKQLMD